MQTEATAREGSRQKKSFPYEDYGHELCEAKRKREVAALKKAKEKEKCQHVEGRSPELKRLKSAMAFKHSVMEHLRERKRKRHQQASTRGFGSLESRKYKSPGMGALVMFSSILPMKSKGHTETIISCK